MSAGRRSARSGRHPERAINVLRKFPQLKSLGQARRREQAGLNFRVGRFCQETQRVHGLCLRRLSEDERSEEHTSELQSLMRISYAVFCLKKKRKQRD